MTDLRTLRARAKSMRRLPTDAERALWRIVRRRQLAGLKFRRQAPVGRYIVDFVCLWPRLVVEADGDQHADSAYDATRDAWLRAQGFTVLRFSNLEVLTNPGGVAAAILQASRRGETPHPPTA